MSIIELGLFSVFLFAALVFLIKWKRRHDAINLRVNRGLRGYVSGKPRVAPARRADDEENGLIVA